MGVMENKLDTLHQHVAIDLLQGLELVNDDASVLHLGANFVIREILGQVILQNLQLSPTYCHVLGLYPVF